MLSGIVGREEELASLNAFVANFDEGSAALMLEGEAGIGKSTLLAEANSIARDHDMLVLSVTGVQSEANLPFASLHQLLRPVLARSVAGSN